MMRFSMSTALGLAAIFISSEIGHAPSRENAYPAGWAADSPGLATPAQAAPKIPAVCDTSGENEITIACDYAESPASNANTEGHPRILLNRAEISFKTKEENYIRVKLTFTNRSAVFVTEARSVYLAIDNDAGRNMVRRVLPHVDFRKLEPGRPLAFSERLLIGVLRPGGYTVHLWIPNPDPALKFDTANNLMLDNVGVPNRQTGLNTIAAFAIVP